MMRLLRVTFLAIAVVIAAAGLLVVSASAASQPGVGGENPTALLNGGTDQLSHGGFYCPNSNIGVSRRLVTGVAKRAKVSNDQALDWLCTGNAPREIVLARQISKRAGVSIDQVFTLRRQGMSWNAIVTQYDVRNIPGYNNFFFDRDFSNNPFRNRRNGVVIRGNGVWRYNQALGVWVRIRR